MDVSSDRISLSGGTIRALDMSKVKVCHESELPDDMFQQILDAQKSALEQQYSQAPDISGNQTYTEYAQVVVNGKVVAKIDNHGFVESSNALGSNLEDAITQADQAAGVLSGPLLAQSRAEKIAEQLGGTVVKSSTALTQSQFDAIPQPVAKIDFDAMQRDPLYKHLQTIQQMRTAFMAQLLAQT